eukprot:snap_masked-scaffold_26-processed-gene-0.40-mRNA-1 protein AED:1.00 eAED:1.00 QI:0/-1/0/0/-1/1/1/0/811
MYKKSQTLLLKSKQFSFSALCMLFLQNRTDLNISFAEKLLQKTKDKNGLLILNSARQDFLSCRNLVEQSDVDFREKEVTLAEIDFASGNFEDSHIKYKKLLDRNRNEDFNIWTRFFECWFLQRLSSEKKENEIKDFEIVVLDLLGDDADLSRGLILTKISFYFRVLLFLLTEEISPLSIAKQIWLQKFFSSLTLFINKFGTKVFCFKEIRNFLLPFCPTLDSKEEKNITFPPISQSLFFHGPDYINVSTKHRRRFRYETQIWDRKKFQGILKGISGSQFQNFISDLISLKEKSLQNTAASLEERAGYLLTIESIFIFLGFHDLAQNKNNLIWRPLFKFLFSNRCSSVSLAYKELTLFCLQHCDSFSTEVKLSILDFLLPSLNEEFDYNVVLFRLNQYSERNCPSSALQEFFKLKVGNIQIDTLSHLILPALFKGLDSNYLVQLKKIVDYNSSVELRYFEYIQQALKEKNFVKAVDLVHVSKRHKYSLQIKSAQLFLFRQKIFNLIPKSSKKGLQVEKAKLSSAQAKSLISNIKSNLELFQHVLDIDFPKLISNIDCRILSEFRVRNKNNLSDNDERSLKLAKEVERFTLLSQILNSVLMKQEVSALKQKLRANMLQSGEISTSKIENISSLKQFGMVLFKHIELYETLLLASDDKNSDLENDKMLLKIQLNDLQSSIKLFADFALVGIEGAGVLSTVLQTVVSWISILRCCFSGLNFGALINEKEAQDLFNASKAQLKRFLLNISSRLAHSDDSILSLPELLSTEDIGLTTGEQSQIHLAAEEIGKTMAKEKVEFRNKLNSLVLSLSSLIG